MSMVSFPYTDLAAEFEGKGIQARDKKKKRKISTVLSL